MNKRRDRVCKKIGWHLEEINIGNAADHILIPNSYFENCKDIS